MATVDKITMVSTSLQYIRKKRRWEAVEENILMILSDKIKASVLPD